MARAEVPAQAVGHGILKTHFGECGGGVLPERNTRRTDTDAVECGEIRQVRNGFLIAAHHR